MKNWTRRATAGLVSTGVIAALAAAPGSAQAAAADQVRLIVGYKSGAESAVDKLLGTLGASDTAASAAGLQALDVLGAKSVSVSRLQTAIALATLRRDPDVSYAEVDPVLKKSDVTPNDTYYSLQKELQDVHVPTAWDTTTGGNVKIAVVDTGVNAVGDLSGAVTSGYNFVSNNTNTRDDLVEVLDDGSTIYGHGTTVAGLIAGRGNDGVGIAGVCWSCTILPVKVLDYQGSGYASTVAKGIVYAANNGAKVINLSLGGGGASVLADAVAYANYKGAIVVAAAGNENTSKPSYPAAYGDVLSVGATETGTKNRATYSNYNSSTAKWVDVVAPGTVVGMNANGDYYSGMQGTSFATPIVSGIAGLIQTAHPTWTGWSVQHAIWLSGDKSNTWSNYGMVDASKGFNQGTDSTSPNITGVSPGQNAHVHGTISVVPSGVSDGWSGVRSVDLYVDGKWKTYDRTAPWGLTYNTAGRNGTVQLQVRVYDKAGNYKAYNRTIIADNTPPTVKITKAPKNKSKIKGTVKIYYTGSDKYGVAKYQLLINGKVVSTHTNTAYFSFKASKYAKNITVQVRAYDKAGNAKLSTKYAYHR